MSSDPTSTGALVALDAGNSKTDVVVIDAAGRVLARSTGRGFRGDGRSVADGTEDLRELVAGVVAAAGSPEIDVIAAYLANVDFPDEERQAHEAIVSWRLARTVKVGNDTLALLRSGIPRPVGVAVVCGAGANAVGLGEDGAVARFAALGAVTGDWGGGGQLASEAMFHASRGEDGRGPVTLLSSLIGEHFGCRGALHVAELMHLGRLSWDRLHETVPLVFAAADDGDAAARAIIERQAMEIALFAVTALRRVGLAGRPVDVVFGGGVLAARHPLLNDRAEALIHTDCPLARIVTPELSPISGAALLALDDLPLDPDGRAVAEERLRRALSEPAPVLSSVH